MKTSVVLSLLMVFFVQMGWSQNQTTVIANSTEISDNLDLRAVASLFGDSNSLEDFEYRLNDPKLRISNLDLNYDRQVDYLRVVESIENGAHLVVIQAVLERDVYQDIATIEVERKGTTYVTQVVGNPYFYGANYIYQPVYYSRPALFSVVFQIGYRPYVSPWYYGYYPRHFAYWNPYPIYRYRKHVHHHINVHHHYSFVNVRHSSSAPRLYNSIRRDAYEVRHPQRAFAVRHQNVSNRNELGRGSAIGAASTRNTATTRTAQRNDYRNTTTAVSRANQSRNSSVNSSATTRTERSTATNARGQNSRNESVRSTARAATTDARSAATNSVNSTRSATPTRASAPVARSSSQPATRANQSDQSQRFTPTTANRSQGQQASRANQSRENQRATATARSKQSTSRSASNPAERNSR